MTPPPLCLCVFRWRATLITDHPGGSGSPRPQTVAAGVSSAGLQSAPGPAAPDPRPVRVDVSGSADMLPLLVVAIGKYLHALIKA